MDNENINQVNETENEESLSQVLQIRRDKLASLKDEGRDPFTITKYEVTAYTTDIANDFEAMEGKRVRIAGRMTEFSR